MLISKYSSRYYNNNNNNNNNNTVLNVDFQSIYYNVQLFKKFKCCQYDGVGNQLALIGQLALIKRKLLF